MPKLYHASCTYKFGEPLLSYNMIWEITGTKPDWRWQDLNEDSMEGQQSADSVSLSPSRAEAEEFNRLFLDGRGVILEVELPENGDSDAWEVLQTDLWDQIGQRVDGPRPRQLFGRTGRGRRHSIHEDPNHHESPRRLTMWSVLK